MRKESAVPSMTFYHGTDAKFILNIIEKGLLARKPVGIPTAAKAVYLTAEVETAATYAGVKERPIILEVKVSSPKRMNKIQQDSLDREDVVFEENQWEEDTQYLKSKIREVLNLNKYSALPLELRWLDDEPEAIKGNNIFKSILQYGRNNNIDIAELKNRMFKSLPPGRDFEIFEILPDGTIGLTEKFYSSAHQLTYPKSLPAVTIKSVWIPKDVLTESAINLATNSKFMGFRLLIGTVELLNETISDINHYRVRSRKYIDKGDDGLKELKSDIKDELDAFFKDPTTHDLVKDIFSEIISADSFEEIEDILSNTFIDPGVTSGKREWLNFPISSLEELRGVGKLYSNSPNLLAEAADRYIDLIKVI